MLLLLLMKQHSQKHKINNNLLRTAFAGVIYSVPGMGVISRADDYNIYAKSNMQVNDYGEHPTFYRKKVTPMEYRLKTLNQCLTCWSGYFALQTCHPLMETWMTGCVGDCVCAYGKSGISQRQRYVIW